MQTFFLHFLVYFVVQLRNLAEKCWERAHMCFCLPLKGTVSHMCYTWNLIRHKAYYCSFLYNQLNKYMLMHFLGKCYCSSFVVFSLLHCKSKDFNFNRWDHSTGPLIGVVIRKWAFLKANGYSLLHFNKYNGQ